MSIAHNIVAFVPNGDGSAVMRAVSVGEQTVAIELDYDRSALLGLAADLLTCARVKEAEFRDGMLTIEASQ